MTIEEKKQWIVQFLGDSFVRGVSIKGNTAKVVVKTEEGEKEVVISLPNPDVAIYK